MQKLVVGLGIAVLSLPFNAIPTNGCAFMRPDRSHAKHLCLKVSYLTRLKQRNTPPNLSYSVRGFEFSLRKVEYDGLLREFAVGVPRGLDPTKQYPLLVLLHPATSEPFSFASQWLDLARQEEYLILAPVGTLDEGRRPRYQWNGPHFAGEAFNDDVDDVGFIGFAVDQVLDELPVNPEEILAIGMSNGAAMVSKLAEPLPQISGLGIHSGTIGGQPANSNDFLRSAPLTRSKPIVFVHGLQDEIININGGPTSTPFPTSDPRVDLKLLPANTRLPDGSTVPNDGLTSSVEGLTENFSCTALTVQTSNIGYRYHQVCNDKPTTVYVLTQGEHDFFFPGTLSGRSSAFDSRRVIVNELLGAIAP